MIRVFAFVTALFMAVPAVAAVEIEEVTSEKGMTAWLVEEHSIPFVALQIIFKGGANLDPTDKRGVTALMMALIEEGAGDMDARAFATAQEGLAASFGFDAHNGTTPSSTARPNNAMKPTQTAVLSSTPIVATAIMPPANATGIPENTANEIEKLRNSM